MRTLEEIEQAIERVPDGPWEVAAFTERVTGHWTQFIADCRSEETARFIAVARTDVPEMIAEIRRLRALLEDR